jgi:HSP20 family protein
LRTIQQKIVRSIDMGTKENAKPSEARKTETPGTPAVTGRGGPVSFADLDRWFDEQMASGWLAPLRTHWPRWPGFAEIRAPFEGRWPKVDVIDRDDEIVIRAELPGVSKDDIDVSVTERAVTIKAKTKSESKEEKEHYYRCETTSGEFERSVMLPQEVESDGAQAGLKDGILELRLRKVKKSARKQIKIA